MTEKKKKLKNNLRQIIMEYIQDHAVNSRIPSERDISAALDINRYSIRKHLAAFEREGWISKNGRQGMFLCSQAEIRDTYGLITGDGSNYSYLDGPDMIAGILRAFSEHNCIVRNLPFSSVSQIPQTVQRFGLKGVIWVEPNIPEKTECFDILRQKQIPLVFCSENYYLYNDFDHLSNTVSLDWAELTRLRAEFFIAHGRKNIVYYATDSTPSFTLFRKHLACLGVKLPDECVIPKGDLLESCLPSLIKKYPIDGILVDGASMCYEHLFAFLHRNPDFRPLLSVENHPKVQSQLRQYPEIKVDFQFESLHDFYFKLGVRSMEMLERAKDGDLIQKPEKYCPEIIDRKFMKWKQQTLTGGIE